LNRFETYAGNKNAPENEKFQVLLDCLGGEARELIQGYTEVTYEKGMYVQVMTLLGEHYGDSRNLKTLLMNKLNAIQPIKKFDLASCTKIVNVLDDFEFRAKKFCGKSKRALRFFYESLDIHAERILSLLPPAERARFFRKMCKRGLDYNFRTVQVWFQQRYSAIVQQLKFERGFEVDEPSKSNFTIQEETESDLERVKSYHSRQSKKTVCDNPYSKQLAE